MKKVYLLWISRTKNTMNWYLDKIFSTKTKANQYAKIKKGSLIEEWDVDETDKT